jgi:hypothetical protein
VRSFAFFEEYFGIKNPFLLFAEMRPSPEKPFISG